MSPTANPPFYVYILRCADGSYYVGHTNDLDSRVRTHNDGRGATWTRCRRPVRLVYTEPSASQASAMAREKQLKRWSAAKKRASSRATSAISYGSGLIPTRVRRLFGCAT